MAASTVMVSAGTPAVWVLLAAGSEPVEFDSGKAVAPKLGEERPKSPKQEVTLQEGVELVDVDGGVSPSTSA